MVFYGKYINTIIMRKIRNFIIFLFIAIFAVSCATVKAEDVSSNLKIRKGTFIKVLVPIEFSTLSADIGDELFFINTQDMYIYETLVLPENSKVYGEIEEVFEPIAGRDGAMKVLINKIITPDRKVYKVSGHIYSENNNYLGGKETQTMYYRKVPHYTQRLRPMLQAAPLNVYEMGKHTIVKPGAELFVILEDDVQIK